MKPEELPEDSLTESLLEQYGDLINKYFGGKAPTEKEQKQALDFLARTSANCNQSTKTYQPYDYSKWYNY